MGVERRREPRIRCNIPCELRIAGQSVAGKVRNLSAGGLGVVAEAPEVDQGDEVAVTLKVPGPRPIELRALFWHARALSRSGSDKEARLFGLVLSDAAPEFARLVERFGAKQPRTAAAPRGTASSPILRAAAARLSARPPDARGLPPPPRAASEPDAPPPDAPPAADAVSAAPELPPGPRQYRIRIKQSGGSRTCRVVASGASPEAAAAAACSEVGPGWIVLEVTPIP
jgi:PilZ domain